ncbi:hypothetical protein CSC71_07540 [Pseudoxanthomonas sangjuensis]|uniref:DUF6988 family protein n=1 Tax=Pseudoxanthomonas sangjuensis TaxID=1503750 RepID=UPI001390B1CF|nr:hypothetical protein [Pseudoxanthomonas sangjuensis]KAF1713525.1 hypothetical protein CSC71_07540 [Pseudoxanthomonas sangjuensis]
MDFGRTETLLGHLADIVDLQPYSNSDRQILSRTLTSTSLHFAASVRTLCQAELALGAAAVLRSQFEALVRSIWVLHRATDAQIEKLSTFLSAESQQANKNIPLLNEMLADLERIPQLQNLLVSLKEFKESSWQPLNSFVHAGIHAIHWTKWPSPPALYENMFKSSNGLAMLAFQNLAILTGHPTLQREVIAACASFSSCLPPHR